jgi:hypothetical protein
VPYWYIIITNNYGDCLYQHSYLYLQADSSHNDVLPLTITKDTYLWLKIDDVYTTLPIRGNGQSLELKFGNQYMVYISTAGNNTEPFNNFIDSPYFVNPVYIEVPPGNPTAINIHKIFKSINVPVTDELLLEAIDFNQVLNIPYVEPLNPQSQKMVVDYFRIIDAKPRKLDEP